MAFSSQSSRHVMVSAANVSAEGNIDLVIGPMFSGKTTELVRRVRRHLAASKKCILVKYKGDNRCNEDPVLSTHDQTQMSAKSVCTLSEVANAAWHYDVIAIDEGQFFPGEDKHETTVVLESSAALTNTQPVERKQQQRCVSSISYACMLCRSCGICRALGKPREACSCVSTGRNISAQSIQQCAGPATPFRECD